MADSSSNRERRRSIGRLALLTLASTLVGCGGGALPTPSTTGGKDTPPADTSPVVVDGSSTVFRISKAAQEEFAKVDDQVEVVVSSSGTSGGFSKYLQNEVDIVDASRAAKPDEESKANAQGMAWTRFLVGYDGITVVVNSKNDFVKELTVEHLKKLWEPGSRVKTWKDLDAAWPAREIKLYCPDKMSGTFEFFTEAVVGKARSQREDVQASSDDNTLVRGVGGDPDGLGYFGYAYYKANASTLRAIPIKKDAEAPAIEPSPETILSKAYTPLARPLFIYVKKSSYRRPGVAAFVKFYLENIGDLATKAKYVPPTAEDLKANKDAITPSVEAKAPAS